MSQDFVIDTLADAEPPSNLDLLSLNDLAYRLGYRRALLEDIAEHAGSLYDPFDKQPKLRWFAKRVSPPKRRVIDNPDDVLKAIQKRIEKALLRPLTFPHYLCGGVKGRSVIDNVSMHRGARVLITLDVKSFFPSIRPTAVYKVWTEILGCSPPVAGVLTRLTTFKRHLPQGAPTSTLLANLVLYSVDGPIRETCLRNDVRYSTWVDDLALSGDRARNVIQTAVGALRAGGFRVSHRKLRVMGTGGRMILNGVLLGRFPGVVRERIGQLRSGIHKLRSGAVPVYDLERFCKSLEGAIRHISSIVPRRAERLRAEYEEARASLASRQRPLDLSLVEEEFAIW